MAKLLKNISCQQMDALAGRFKNHLDFYFWKGIPCVRLWPKLYSGVISKSQTAAYEAFSAIAKMKPLLSPEIKESMTDWVADTTWTWADLFTSRAMEFWHLTGRLPPLTDESTSTYGSGLKHIVMHSNSPQQPWICRRLPKKAKESWKEYRGTKEICIQPAWGDPIVCVPMSLMYSSGVGFTPPWNSKYRTGQHGLYPSFFCHDWRALALEAFNSAAESRPAYNYGLVYQHLKLDPPNFYRIYTTRPYAQFTAPDYYAGVQLSRYCGISYTRSATKTAQWPGGAWSVSVFGNHYHYNVPDVPVEERVVHGCALYPGRKYNINIFHPDHYNMPAYPTCETGISPQQSQFNHTGYQLLIGERWWWEYTFTPPYRRNWWVSYKDNQGNIIPLYPLTKKAKPLFPLPPEDHSPPPFIPEVENPADHEDDFPPVNWWD